MVIRWFRRVVASPATPSASQTLAESMLARVRRWQKWWSLQPQPPSVDEMQQAQARRDEEWRERMAERVAKALARDRYWFPE